MKTRRQWDSSDKSVTCHSPVVVKFGAVCSFLIGGVMCVILSIIASLRIYKEILHIIDVDFNDDNGNLFGEDNIKKIIAFSILCSVFTCMLGAMGYVAAEKDSRHMMCLYIFGTLSSSMIYFVVFLFGEKWNEIVSPVLDRQSGEFCNPLIHWKFIYALECGKDHEEIKRIAVDNENTFSDCNEECQSRVKLIKHMGGCSVLYDLCHSFEYHEWGTGYCQVDFPESHPYWHHIYPPMWQATGVSQTCCNFACDRQVRCQGYVYGPDVDSGTCALLSPIPPRTPSTPGTTTRAPEALCSSFITNTSCPTSHCTWKSAICQEDRRLKGVDSPENNDGDQARNETEETHELLEECGSHVFTASPVSPNASKWDINVKYPAVVTTDGKAGFTCREKARPVLVTEGIKVGVALTWASLVACVALAAASVCGVAYQYTLVTKRKGKKGADALLFRMICPCMKPQASDASRNKFEYIMRNEDRSSSDESE